MTSLDIDAAIGAHTAWKRRFEFMLDGIIDDTIDRERAGDDTRCVLGCWLFSKDQEHTDLPIYSVLVDTHREFHNVASQIIDAIDASDVVLAKQLLDTTFNGLSREVVALLEHLRTLLRQ